MSGPSTSTSDSDNWCASKSRLIELTSTWEIENAHYVCRPLQDMVSSPFISSDGSIRWSMRLCASIVQYDSQRSTCAALVKIEGDIVNHIDYEITIQSKNQKESIIWKYCGTTDNIWSSVPLDEFYAMLDRISKDQNGTLILSCTIKVVKIINNAYKHPTVEPFSDYIDADLMREGKYSDVILVAGNREIKAHKVVLASRSAVFRAMFDSNMLESSTNRVKITDLDYEVVEEMIHFIYTGHSPKLRKMADRLLGAAEKYALKQLRSLCEQTLCAELSVDNAFKMMAIAELYNVNHLKAQVLTVIRDNLGNVMESANWKQMIRQEILNSAGHN